MCFLLNIFSPLRSTWSGAPCCTLWTFCCQCFSSSVWTWHHSWSLTAEERSSPLKSRCSLLWRFFSSSSTTSCRPRPTASPWLVRDLWKRMIYLQSCSSQWSQTLHSPCLWGLRLPDELQIVLFILLIVIFLCSISLWSQITYDPQQSDSYSYCQPRVKHNLLLGHFWIAALNFRKWFLELIYFIQLYHPDICQILQNKVHNIFSKIQRKENELPGMGIKAKWLYLRQLQMNNQL